ncbi:bifunctional phosphopantothenoylcysteine decarboxylase/phosphopantothenate--cysteine ligase CoaBC [bacterium]|nr:bifunctional phosphopantothenoylcysteine decarboxylase/phosphopantothenate--cysteine ligase CoaBC [bacterium]
MNFDVLKDKNVLMIVSGGIAAYKSVLLLRELTNCGASVQVVGTENSLNFVGKATWEALSGRQPLFGTFETPDSSKITHITLAQDVDLIIAAPATANIIAKAACGIADDLATSIFAAATAPVLIAPAMNSAMYRNPANLKNIETLQGRPGFHVMAPASGALACGSDGIGRMAEPHEITVEAAGLLSPKPARGTSWLVTGGATREYIDPVRFISNGSSGRTAFEIADAAHAAGGEVTLLGVNAEPAFNPGYTFLKSSTAAETAGIVKENVRNADIFIMTAAIADYSPVKAPSKIKKGEASISLTLDKTTDILAASADWTKPGAVRIGFAAETDDLEKNALAKLKRKKLDLIVANRVSDDFSPFGSESNSVLFITENSTEEFKNITKCKLAQLLVERAVAIYRVKHGND